MKGDSKRQVTSELTDIECPPALQTSNVIRNVSSDDKGTDEMDNGENTEKDIAISIIIAFAFICLIFLVYFSRMSTPNYNYHVPCHYQVIKSFLRFFSSSSILPAFLNMYSLYVLIFRPFSASVILTAPSMSVLNTSASDSLPMTS